MDKKTPEEMATITIDSLMEFNNEHKITIYTLLVVLYGYITDVNYSAACRDGQMKVIRRTLENHNSKNIDDVMVHLNQCLKIAEQQQLRNMKPLPGIH